jgi:hypothetical protein
VIVPGVGNLPWELIAEFREHHGNEEARAKLRAAEERALTQDPQDANEFFQLVAPEITKELFAVIDELAGSTGLDIAKHAASTATSLVPFASEIAAIGETALAARRRHRAWYAALMKLATPD